MPSDNKPWPETLLTEIFAAIWRYRAKMSWKLNNMPCAVVHKKSCLLRFKSADLNVFCILYLPKYNPKTCWCIGNSHYNDFTWVLMRFLYLRKLYCYFKACSDQLHDTLTARPYWPFARVPGERVVVFLHEAWVRRKTFRVMTSSWLGEYFRDIPW